MLRPAVSRAASRRLIESLLVVPAVASLLFLAACGGEGQDSVATTTAMPVAVPTAAATAPRLVAPGSTLTLDASGSSVSAGMPVYLWTQTYPTGSTFTSALERPTVPVPSDVDAMVFELRVTDDGITDPMATNSSTTMVQVNIVEDPANSVFVDAGTGQDISGNGTIDAPYETLSFAVSRISSTPRPDIYIKAILDGNDRCDSNDAASYVGNVTIDGPVSVYGGFDAEWKRDLVDCKTQISGRFGGPTLEFTNVTGSGTTLSGVKLRTRIPRSATNVPQVTSTQSNGDIELFGLRISSGAGSFAVRDSEILVDDWDRSVGPGSVGIYAEAIGELIVEDSEIRSGDSGAGMDGADGMEPSVSAANDGGDGAVSAISYVQFVDGAYVLAEVNRASGGNAACAGNVISGSSGGAGGGGGALFADFINTATTLSGADDLGAPVSVRLNLAQADGIDVGLIGASDLLDSAGNTQVNFSNRRAGYTGSNTSGDLLCPGRVSRSASTAVGFDSAPRSGLDGALGCDGLDGFDGPPAGSALLFGGGGSVSFRSEDGTDGQLGFGGQGGGGGASAIATRTASSRAAAAGGGGGGAGGCGGEAGELGTTASASVAILLNNVADATIRCNTLGTGDGGDGGEGGRGAAGQSGGAGGAGNADSAASITAGDGGDGGDGGRGGDGGAGAGGPTFAVAVAGGASSITYEANFIALGAPGEWGDRSRAAAGEYLYVYSTAGGLAVLPSADPLTTNSPDGQGLPTPAICR